MPMRRKTMEKVREIVRLKELGNLSERAISRALKVSRPIIKQYLEEIEKAGLDFAAIKEMPDETLLEIVAGDCASRSKKYRILASQFPHFVKELKRTGVTLQLLWEEYREQHPDGYKYSQFCYHFQKWRDNADLSMHIEHKAGDKMFVDFTGKHLFLVDRETGEIRNVEVFVAVLGASQRTYVEATKTQKKHDWIEANQNAFHYFGGVTNAIVPDCLKSAVKKANKYEPDINPEYLDFARHYHTTILPARPARPKDKPLVEGAVKIVYAWIFARLRDRTFHHLEDLNTAIGELLEKYNNKAMQKIKLSRNELFNEIEKDALKPLPVEKYVKRHFKSVKAQFNYHVYLGEDEHYYSVPYRYKGKKINAFYTQNTIELFFENTRIAFHKRSTGIKNRYTTLKEHMPPNHQFVDGWCPQKFLNWAGNLGEHVEQVITHILARPQHPEQAYKVCLGILNLEKLYSKERLNKACQRAVEFQHYSYKAIKKILARKIEDCQLDIFQLPSDHKNVRGKQYYL